MGEERVHYHEITISKQTYLYYLQSCRCLELPDDDYTTEFEGEELINIESARFRRWLDAIAKHFDKFIHRMGMLNMLYRFEMKEPDSEFEALKGTISDFCYKFENYSQIQNFYIVVFRMIADEDSHASRMSNLESTVLRLEKKIENTSVQGENCQMHEERVHHHEITMSKQIHPYYLISCECLDLPNDDYSTKGFDGEELIRLESARFKRWLDAIAKNTEEIWCQWRDLNILSYTEEKEFDSEKFENLQNMIFDFSYNWSSNKLEHQTYHIVVFRMIAEENSHFSRMSNLQSAVLRLEKKIDSD